MSPCVVKVTGLNRAGYARLWVRRDDGTRWQVFAHRWAWQQVHGPIPEGLTVDHICERPNCHNVEHLQLVSRAKNARLQQERKQQTTCHRGHPLTSDNLVSGTVWRSCKTCHRDRERARKARVREAARSSSTEAGS